MAQNGEIEKVTQIFPDDLDRFTVQVHYNGTLNHTISFDTLEIAERYCKCVALNREDEFDMRPGPAYDIR